MKTKSLVTFPFRALFKTGEFLVKKQMLKEHSGAQFAGRREYKQFLNPANEGLLLDGDKLRLSERESFQNVCVIARVGAGKTSQYIIPNVLDKAERNCSLVINDPKGEVYEQTSQYMKDKGFEILVIDPENLDHSSRFNPLWKPKAALSWSRLRKFSSMLEIQVPAIRSGTMEPSVSPACFSNAWSMPPMRTRPIFAAQSLLFVAEFW